MAKLLTLSDRDLETINGGRYRRNDISARGKYAVAAGRTRDVYQDSTVQTLVINGGKLTANDMGVIGFYNA